jgi:hypothetical protein
LEKNMGRKIIGGADQIGYDPLGLDSTEVALDTIVKGKGTYFAVAPDTRTDAGAVAITSYYTTIVTTTASAITLADGTEPGQMKKITMSVDVGDATLTPVTLAGGTTIVFSVVGDTAEMVWDGTTWTAIALYNQVSSLVTTPVLA